MKRLTYLSDDARSHITYSDDGVMATIVVQTKHGQSSVTISEEALRYFIENKDQAEPLQFPGLS